MANWKEIGVVPDSDDEDSSDNENEAFFEAISTKQRLDALPARDGSIQINKDNAEGYEVEEPGHKEASDDRDHGTTSDLPNSSPKSPSTNKVGNDFVQPTPSPISPRVFKDPRDIWMLDDDTPGRVSKHDFLQEPLQDEISQSYVRVTSPMSSALSSLPPSQSLSGIQLSQRSEAGQQEVNLESVASTASHRMFSEAINPRQRSFRQRNPIQLRPYVVEHEKYRRTLQARGMKPMRLLQSQDGRRKSHEEAGSPGQYTQEQDSQEMDLETEESQPLDSVLYPSPPSPKVKDATDADNSISDSESRSDDDFPDIDELLRRQNHVLRPLKAKHRLKSYSIKPRRPKLPEPQHRSLGKSNQARDLPVNNVSASPPPTSSPFAAISDSTRAFQSKPAQDREHNWHLDDDETISGNFANLLTPATSSIKPLSILINSESENEGVFPSRQDASSSSPSSDDSVQIRQVRKKIRGVLPASHLRLDQQLRKPGQSRHNQREYLSASPDKQSPRRGVALPSTRRSGPRTSNSIEPSFPLFSDDSSEESSDGRTNESMGRDDIPQLDALFTEQRIGYAEEDDKIDAMLPSRKRPGRGLDIHPRKKRRVKPINSHGMRPYARQPKITEHLAKARKAASSKSNNARRPTYRGNKLSPGHRSRIRRHKSINLSILDVTGNSRQEVREMPRFIRIAARTARSRKNQGRQSPTRKFIRLANREDTFDAQSVLRGWREGKLQQKALASSNAILSSHTPLNSISGNAQDRIPSQMAPTNPQYFGSRPERGIVNIPRKLMVSRKEQRPMSDFVTSLSPTTEHCLPEPVSSGQKVVTRKRHESSRFSVTQSRPAQLESAELDYSYRHPNAAFGSTKNALDSLYRYVRKRPPSQANLQLSRFLAEDDDIRPSIESEEPLIRNGVKIAAAGSILDKQSRMRKRRPQRVDAGAAIYRQPSEPLVLELLLPTRPDHFNETKLAGLGKFGTHYPIHFDVFPLQPGIFFHESTFIGSGCLFNIIKNNDLNLLDVSRPVTNLLVGEKHFHWGLWSENVSSEIGLSFDWLLDQFSLRNALDSAHTTHIFAAEVIRSIIDYVQYGVRFTTLREGLDFLNRMIIVLSDFTARFKAEEADLVHSQQRVEVMTGCTVIVFQLLQVSRRFPEYLSLVGKLEDLLVAISRSCIRLLLVRGIEDVRKLCDDLQYLSFREKGIKEPLNTSHTWVVHMKVLAAAKVPGKSFWEITNTQLLDNDLASINDARIMEKIWYTMFSLLPLCEFDESGVVIQDARHSASFDNWWIPQRVIKSVFTFYSLNPRQSPSFNDYCRALFSRCHYLMVEWGWWKCGAIIGTLFDFFASQSLEHLRNEEVHKSPQFLDELDKQPSLAVDTEDRCFHIFLKIVAQSIKHFSQARQVKNIRHLVTRLLPNHDRQYPKEEDILERELAALRNHHDLLCTIFWAAPPGQRPPLSLIQDLVKGDRSHNAACLINLRAWNQLVRFVLTSAPISGPFEPFIAWQNEFFARICDQYLQEDANTRRQAELHVASGADFISEARLQQQITTNRKSTMVTLRRVLRNVLDSITFAQNCSDLLAAFNTDVLTPPLISDFDEDCFDDVMKILLIYMERVDHLHPYIEAQHGTLPISAEEDSQTSVDMNLNLDRQMLIFPLCNKILPFLYPLCRKIIEYRVYSDKRLTCLPTLIQCWTRLISLATEESFKLEEFLPGGSKAIFTSRYGSKRANMHWPLFLAEILRSINLAKLLIKNRFDIYLEWLMVLTDPDPVYENALSYQFHRCGAYLVRHDNRSMQILPRVGLLQDAIDIMREVYRASRNGDIGALPEHVQSLLDTSGEITSREIKAYLSYILKEVMGSMQYHLGIMIPGSVAHTKYLQFCRDIVSHIRSRAGNIQPLTKYFTTPSAKFWPEDSDPTFYAAGIVSYSLRLRDDEPARVSAELSHYLWMGWRHDFVKGQMLNHVSYITKGLKYFDFLDFMLNSYVPAVLEVSFSSDCGWIIPSTYLPPLAKRIIRDLENRGTKVAEIFGSSINLLKLILNGLAFLSVEWDGIKGIHPKNRGIIAVACQFCISISPSIQAYVEDHPDQMEAFDAVSNALTMFSQFAILKFKDENRGGLGMNLLERTEGPYVNDFVAMMMADINTQWSLGTGGSDSAMASSNGWIELRSSSPSDHTMHRIELGQLWGRTLVEILGVGLSRGLPLQQRLEGPSGKMIRYLDQSCADQELFF